MQPERPSRVSPPLRALFVCLIVFAFAAHLAGAAAPAEAQGSAPVLKVSLDSASLAVGTQTTLYLVVDGVQGLYGIDVVLSYDAALLQVLDVDSAIPGVQVEPWPQLSAAERQQTMTLMREADNGAGTIRLVSTRINPLPPVTGSAVLLSARVRAVSAGSGAIAVQQSLLADTDGGALDHTTVAGAYTVTEPSTQEPAVYLLRLPFMRRG